MTAQGAGFARAQYDVVVTASSAGGLYALRVVLSCLPADLPASLLICQHLSPNYPSHLAEILDQASALTVRQASQGAAVLPGMAFIAPPDYHMLLAPNFTLNLSHGERVAFSRPSADLLMESAAGVCGARAIAVVMTGMGSDGARGAQMIQRAGGIVLIQDPLSAEFPSMPLAARRGGAVHFVLPLEQIAKKILSLILNGPRE